MLNFGNLVLSDNQKKSDVKDIQLLQRLVDLETQLKNLLSTSTESLNNVSEEALNKVREAIANEGTDVYAKLSELKAYFDNKKQTMKTVKLPAILAKKLKHVNPYVKINSDNEVDLGSLNITAWAERFKSGSTTKAKYIGKDFNKVCNSIGNARNALAVLLSIKRFIDREEKLENQKIIPPKHNTGKFQASARKNRETVKPAYHNGSFNY